MTKTERTIGAGEALARAVRVMSKLGYFDPACHASVRSPAGIHVTPDFDSSAVPSPRTIGAEDLLTLGATDEEGSARNAVTALHRRVYESRPDVGAILFVFPPTAMAFVAARRPLRRVTHAEAWMVDTVAPFVDFLSYAEDPAGIAASVDPQDRIMPVAAAGIAFLAPDIDVAIANVYSYEYLARMNLLASSLPSEPREVTSEEIDTIQTERATPETVGSVDGRAFLRSFDGPVTQKFSADDSSVEGRVALSCRILASHHTLVGFYEHVSHRLEGQDAFAMSPAKNFAQIRPEDVLVVGLDDEATWISGSHPPAPFRRFHRDIFLARPDVRAIVHTHEMYGRVFVGADRNLAVLDRYGVNIPAAPPRLGRASMVFEELDRRDAVKALGRASIYHTDLHGTDYVSSTIEDATIVAVHREIAYRTLHTALRVGDPVPLTSEEASRLARTLPGAAAWWRMYSDLLIDNADEVVRKEER